MTNPYFSQTGYPATRQTGPTSAPLRAEFALIAAAFDKLPTLVGNGNKLTKVNSGANGLTTTGLYEVGGKLGVNTSAPGGWIEVKPSAAGEIAYRGTGAAGGSANILLQGDNGSATAFWISATSGSKLIIGGTGGTEPSAGILTIDNAGYLVQAVQNTSPSLGTNMTLAVALTSNTNLRFSARGSDGVTRVGNLTIA